MKRTWVIGLALGVGALACGQEAQNVDAGTVDSGPSDLGTPDLGTADLGTADLGTADAGFAALDPCPLDGGFDAGLAGQLWFLVWSDNLYGQYRPFLPADGIGESLGCAGACVVRVAYPTDGGVVDGGPPVATGTISVAGPGPTIVLTAPGYAGHGAATVAGGELLSITATGDPNGYGPWSASLALPTPGLAYSSSLPSSHPLGQALELRWSPVTVASGTLELTMRNVGAAQERSALCSFPVAAGAAVVPPAVLAALGAGPANLSVSTVSSLRLGTPPLEISLRAHQETLSLELR